MILESTTGVTIVEFSVFAMTAYILLLLARTRASIGGKSAPLKQPAVYFFLPIAGLELVALHALPLVYGPEVMPETLGLVARYHSWLIIPLCTAVIAAGVHLNARAFRKIYEKLQTNEARLTDFASSSSDWFWETGPDLKFTYLSDRYFNLNNLKANKLIGATSAEILRDKNTFCGAEAVDTHLADLESRRPFKNFQYSFLTRSGVTVHVRTSGVPVFGPNGDFRGYRGTGSDITATRLAEIRLAESEALLRGIVDHTPASINLKDLEGNFVFVNKRFSEQFNVDREGIIGKPVSHIFSKEYAGVYGNHDELMKATRKAVTREVAVPFADGTIHHMLNTKFPVFDSTGQLSGIGSIGADISMLKEREAELSEKSAMLQAILDTLPARISILDNDNRMLFVSKSAAEHFNVPVEELLGCTLEEVLGDDYPEQYGHLVREIREAGKFISYPRYKSQLHPEKSQWVLGTPIFLKDKEETDVLLIALDTTEQQRAEDQLRQSQKMEVVGQLTGGVAHDFNNLLAVIIGNLDLMSEILVEDDPFQILIEEATTAALNGGKLNDRLLAFSRQQSLSPVVMNLNEGISSLLSMLRRTLGETITIEASLAEGLWPIDVDPVLVETALLNLAVNARDAMPNGGTLTIETANEKVDANHPMLQPEMDPGEYIMLTLSDTGCGMSAEALAHAFEPFFTTKEVGEGTGLGLSMVFGFVKQAGGHITLDSTLGAGTAVTLYLPRARRAAPEPRGNITTTPVGRGETILLIEDEQTLRSLYARTLESLGYIVLEAGDGNEALKILDDMTRIDLILTDVVLPGGISGPQIAAEAGRIRPEIKCLYMSGYPRDMVTRQSSLDEQIFIMRKPFEKIEIATRLREILDTELPVQPT